MSIAEIRTEREQRRDLNRHLFQMHGGIVSQSLPSNKSLEVLQAFHEALHFDDYACPPHSHTADGSIELTYGDQYVEETYTAQSKLMEDSE